MLIYNKTDDWIGTSLEGYITITYKELVDELGEPHETDGDKSTVEWAFKTAEGVVFTIYDYKTYATPKGVYEWHIGGTGLATDVIKLLFPNHKIEVR